MVYLMSSRNVITGSHLIVSPTGAAALYAVMLVTHSTQSIQGMRKLAREVKSRHPRENAAYDITRDRKKGVRKINTLLQRILEISRSCTLDHPRCEEVSFPREQLIKAYRRTFGARPPKGRIYFRMIRDRHLARFRQTIKKYPKHLVQCD